MPKIPISLREGRIVKNERIVGIDLGTTNSLVAIVDTTTGNPLALRGKAGDSIVPSVVHFAADGSISVGNEGKMHLVEDPENTIYSVKRLMGKSYHDVEALQGHFGYRILDDDTESLVKVRVKDRFYTPIELSSFILTELKQRAEQVLGEPVSKAVITVPAYFNDAQRQATRDAGKLAGLDVLRIVNEPTAASLAYGMGLDKEEEKTVAVYDLGGGTFDISVLHITNGIFEVLSTNGDTFLGGDDFDRMLVEFWLGKNGKTAAECTRHQLQELRLHAEKAKKSLSSGDTFSGMAAGIACAIDRKTFEDIIRPLLDKTISCCRHALNDAGMKPELIDAVIMVGGSTRIPLVKSEVSRFFQQAVNDSLDPDEVVALGAAIQADILAGNRKDLLLLDVTPLSLGIETMGGLMDVIIPRNTKIPTAAARQYTTSKDGQSKLKIAVYQGERDLVRDNRKLAEFILGNIPGMPAGLPKIEILFRLNADGILTVQAKELRSNAEQSIEIKPQYGITEDEMEHMLRESISHAQEDMHTRALVEARVEANNMLDTCTRFLQKNSAVLNAEEIEGTRALMDALREILGSEDKDKIHAAIEALNDFTRPFAERIMDMAISKAMKGKLI